MYVGNNSNVSISYNSNNTNAENESQTLLNKLKTFTAWKVSKYGFISGPYFPVFWLNMDQK